MTADNNVTAPGYEGLPPSRARTPALVERKKIPAALENTPAKGVPFFTPEQFTPAGTALSAANGKIPKLFTPLKIRGVELPNRIWVSPMCQYSAHEGFHTPWHTTHYGGMIQRGPGFTMIEATAVSANGRITPEDSGIWLDAHITKLKEHVDFAHSQNQLISIQLGHAGRKASTVAPWLPQAVATEDVNGWPEDVVGPSDVPYGEGFPTPRALTLDEIAQVKKEFASGVKRALHAGFDIIELHFAHGYLVYSFLSPASNKRTDKYGGSFENRTRLALEIVEETRVILPESTPLVIRFSATDWLDVNPDYEGESWTIKDSLEFAKLLADRGVDVLDISSGGNSPDQKITGGPGYQVGFAKAVKKAVGDRALVSAVGSIKTGTQAEEIISGGKGEDDTPLDLIAVGRMFQKNPGLVWAWADDLETTIQVANQIGWGFGGRASVRKESAKNNAL
ncbi:hypothetical protein ACHAQH_008971 [Verticillium albo-atrum]